ncbi:MAG: N-methylhydantoinase B [Geminicoccaceae bacterium]|jgi:N-methylhydantoinase B|nr:MAG: N-methylhydantoinase B [Geminicoccaceae bacterium]
MPVDPITVSVVQHRLHGIVEEMGEAMLRTSYSQILNSSRDFSTALADPKGRLVAQAEHVPIHVGALPFAVRSVQAAFEGTIRPGDVFLLNDPYRGGNHLPDLTAFVPVFADGRHLFWAINRAHQSDIGGATHGAYNPAATEIWQEGIRVPPLRLYDGGVLREDVLDLLALNVRHPRDFKGDLAAMIGSARLGARRLEALLEELGTELALEAVEAVLDGAERRVRAILASWPDGVYRGEAVLDDDGHGRRDVTIRATVTKRGSDLEVDLSESDPECEGFVNSSYPNSYSACVVALAYLVDADIPKNDGAFRPLTMKVREGTVVHPREGRPVTLCTNHCGQEIIEAIVKALAPACPERAMAGWGRRFRVALKGTDPRNGRPFLWHLFQARPGGGASAAGDGWPAAGEWQAAGGIKFGSLEVHEVRFPLFFARHELRPGSGGDGEHRGGPGAILEMRIEVAEPAVANTAGDGVRHGACGILGGRDGAPHDYRLRSVDGTERILKTKEVGIVVRPGDVLVARSGGGGGWGDPARRSAAARARDRAEGYVEDGAEAGR